MRIVADTSVFLAVVLEQPEKPRIASITADRDLVAPEVLPYELGNALTALLKRRILSRDEIPNAWDALGAIPVELRPVDMHAALNVATRFEIYAYDAYFLECALSLRVPLVTLDRGMRHVARALNIRTLE